jgi:hypothetical protein
MEWLLILSAMLSAVTGAFSGVGGAEARVPQAEAAVGAQVAAAVVEQQAVPARADRPVSASPTTEVAPLVAFTFSAAIPLYADRLIE